MRLGKQHRHCPNCGLALYDDNLTHNHVLSMMCSDKCRSDWELKYARMILRQDAEEKTELQNWLSSKGFEIFCELKHGPVGEVLQLLEDHQISRGKAAEAIAELLTGTTPRLPTKGLI